MKSITKIIILITAIIVFSGYALGYVLRDDIKQPGVSATPSYVKQDSPYLKSCDDISGCVTTDTSVNYPINSDYEVMRPKDPSSPDTEYVISKHGSFRKRRQAVVKTKGSDYGPNSDMSLLARSSSPLRSMKRNRNRRSPSIPETTEISSSQSTTVEEEHTEVVHHRPVMLTNSQRLLISFLTALTMPYFIITPSHNYDYEDTGVLYSS
eukprot:XP_003244140.1 PREDICTED: uncharacterized protein LOC100569625 [Acyrthosiphon pisum]